MPPSILICQAILFDMDGTLVDSNEVIRRTWRYWSAKHGVPLEPILAVEKGRPNREVMEQFAPPGLDVELEADIFRDMETRDITGLTAVAGALDAVAAAQSGKWAVVTSAETSLCEVRLRAVGLPIPDVVVGADSVVRGKPDPECYLLAARQLLVDPRQCVVFEDAPAGVRSGRNAGCTVVGVCTSFRAEALATPYHVRDFRQVAIRISDGNFEIAIADQPAPVLSPK